MIAILQHFLVRPASPRATDAAAGLYRRFRRWRDRRKGIETLRSMSDYMLNDIGLSRFDVDHLVRGPECELARASYAIYGSFRFFSCGQDEAVWSMSDCKR